jgi:hypothetical protein
MEIPASFPIEVWGRIFSDFNQVEYVKAISSAERLDIKVKGKKEILSFSVEALDDTLYKFRGNPKEVAVSFLRENGIIVFYEDTLVGYFDIIGYSSFIKKAASLEEIIHRMKRFLDDASRSARTDIFAVKIDHWILSDSIIVVVDTNRHPLFTGSLDTFLGTCSMILHDGMRHGMPLRGAIGGGSFYKDGEVMVSTALINAAEYEKEQEWLGAVLTPEALQIIEKAKEFELREKGETEIDLSSGRFSTVVGSGTIPWKEQESSLERPPETYFINPDMSEPDWATKYLPSHFQGSSKINNSNSLYGKE